MKSAHLFLTKLTAMLAVCALASIPLAARGANVTWTNLAGGSWANSANWLGGTIPGAVDDTANFSTLTLGSAPLVTLDGATTVGNLVFGDVGNTYGWTLGPGAGDPLTLAVSSGSPTITVNNQTNTISLVLNGSQGLTKAGSGTLVLNGANIFTGNTTNSGGTLQLGDGAVNNGVIAGNMTLASGTTLAFANPFDQTYTGVIVSSTTGGTVIQKGPGALILGVGGQITATNNVTIAAGTTLSLSGADAAAGNNRLPSATAAVWTINGILNSTTTAANTMPPSVILNNGTMTGTKDCYDTFGIFYCTTAGTTFTANGAGNSISLPGGANNIGLTGPLTLNTPLPGDALEVAATINFRSAPGGPLIKSGLGTVVLKGTNTYTSATTVNGGTLIIGAGSRLGNGVYSALITNNGTFSYSSTAAQTLLGVISGTGSLSNSGPGTLTLFASNSYSGATILNGGTTVGVTAGTCGRSSVTVASSAATLSVSITNNTRSWSCTNLTYSAAGTLDFNFGAITPSSSVAPLVVSNAVAFTATPVVTVQGAAFGMLPIGSYPLMTWSSVSGATPTTVTLPPHRGTANLSVVGNTLFLNITSLGTEPLYWTASSGNWDVGLTSNWKDSANTVTPFLNQDSVVFEDVASGAGPITVSLATNVAPTSVTFSNSSKAYTLAGTGAITGSSGLAKTGANSLLVINTNTYTGGTIVSGGTLQLGDGTANNGVVAGNIAVSNGAALAFAYPNDQTYAGVISGGGTMTKSGAGMVTLTASNTYTGGTTINAGTLRLLRPGLINLGPVTVNPAGTLALDSATNVWTSAQPTNRITLNGGTLGLIVVSFQGRYITFGGVVSNAPAASSFITTTVTGGANNPPNASNLFIDNGLTGSGTITISNSASANGIGLCLRTANTSFSGTLIVIGNASPTISAASGLAVGNSAGQPILTNADLQVDGTMEMGNNGTGFGWANGTVNGQTLAIGALNGSGLVIANMGTAGFTRGLNVGGNGHNGVFSGVIVNGVNSTLSLTKSGAGTQTLTGASSYTGTTTVNGGTLLVVNPGSLTSPVSVQSGGTLRGDGALSGAVSVQSGGTLAIGTNSSSPLTTLPIFNTLTFGTGGTNVMRISKNGNVAANDQITGLTSVTYGGTLRVVDITSDATPLALGDTFTLFSAGTYNPSAFGSVILPALPGNLGWDLSNLPVNGSITINNQASAPLFAPGSGGYVGAQAVTISSATVGATIRYTTDGSTPSAGSPIYSAPITVPVPTVSMTIRAYASKVGFGDSAVSSATYSTVITPTWLNVSGGNWSDTSSWSNAVVANGSSVTGNFGALVLSFDPVVTLDTAATVGALVFADQGGAFNWTLADGSAGPLTLNAGVNQPVITVANTNTTISAVLAGANGFIKAGPGTLTLSAVNSYNGNTVVNSGVGELKFTAAPPNTTIIGNGTVEFNYPGTVDDAATFGSGFNGQLRLTGTALRAGNLMSGNLGDVSLDSSSSWNITGSTAQADELTGSGPVITTTIVTPAPATLTLGVNNGNGTNAIHSGAMTAASPDMGRIHIVKNGTGTQQLLGNLATGLGSVTVKGGTLTLGGNNTYSGATTVSNGTLLVNGSLNTNSAVYVASPGTLGGTGTVSGIVTLDGTLSPGASVGSLTVGGAILHPGSILKYEVASATNSTLRDLLTITNTLDLSQLTGPATIRLVSMADATTPGLVPDFDGGAAYTWVIGTAVGLAGAGNLGNLVLDASAFANTHPGTFSLGVQGNSLVVNYSASLTPPVLSGYGPRTGSSFPLIFSGPNGQTYKVLGSTNVALPLASWWQLSSGTFGASPVTFTDTTATNANRFYRIVSP